MRFLSAPRRRAGFLVFLLAAASLIWPVPPPARAAEAGAELVFAVTHAETGTTLVTANSDGHKLGDIRVVSLPTLDPSGAAGRLDSILTTTGVDVPGPGDEQRISHLVFSFTSPDDQIYVAGVATYPAKGSTIKVASSIVRPILGGSGKYAGASGWCVTEHLPDGSWRHTFHLIANTAGTPKPD